MRSVLVASMAVLLLGSSVLAKTTFLSVWKSPTAAGESFKGKKVAALLIDKDDQLRMSAEEALVRELDARDIKATAAYRIVPREELQSADKAKVWFEKQGIEGVVAMRVVASDTVRKFEPSNFTVSYYNNFWGYYGYGWGEVYQSGKMRDQRIVSIETLIFSIPKNALLWAGVSYTEDPMSPAKTVYEVVKEAVKEMKKQGLVSK